MKIQIAENACDVVKSCDVTFSMLSTLDASVEVVLQSTIYEKRYADLITMT